MSQSEPKSSSCSRLFRVKDFDAFVDDCNTVEDVEVGQKNINGVDYAFVYVEEGQWPETRVTDDSEEDIDFSSLIASHLEEDQVAVLESVSFNRKDLHSEVIAVNAQGIRATVDLDDLAACAVQELSDKEGDLHNQLQPKMPVKDLEEIGGRVSMEFLELTETELPDETTDDSDDEAESED